MLNINGQLISWSRVSIIGISLAGLVLIFLFQEYSIGAILLGIKSPSGEFIANRTFRLLCNDLCMLLLISAWFRDKSVTRLAVIIQAIDFFILLPLYLWFKLTWEGPSEISSPLLSQFHRMIVNPTLMILLIPAVYFQQLTKKDG